MKLFTSALMMLLGVLVPIWTGQGSLRAAEAQAELKNISINGGLGDGKAHLTVDAVLNGLSGANEKLMYATTLQHSIQVSRDKLTHAITATIDIVQGEPKELPLILTGDGVIRQVTGGGLQDWSVRQETNGVRVLVLRPFKKEVPLTQLVVEITAEQEAKVAVMPVLPLSLAPSQPALFNGYVKIQAAADLEVKVQKPSGLIPIETPYLPEAMRVKASSESSEPQAFRFLGSAYSMALGMSWADPEMRRVVLRDFKLIGHMTNQSAAFTLTATARVKNPKGGKLTVLSGGLALTELKAQPDWQVRFDRGQFVLWFERDGEFPIELKFNATVRQSNGWNRVDFQVAPASLQPVVLQGLAAETQFEFPGGARPARAGAEFASFLPPNGAVQLSWKEVRPEAEGKLFYAAEMLSQITVSPGLMRQAALLDFKVMQGELSRIPILLHGTGEVTRVQGDQVLAWNLEPVPNSTDRRLVVQLNQSQKDQFTLQLQFQTALGAFPQTAEAMQLRPENATRFAGYLRVVNEGAVRLEISDAKGLSQISPEQFPESDATKAFFRALGGQRFAYRFSGSDFGLKIQADQVLPELTVSQLLTYHLGETELAVEAEMELEVREANLRELLLRVPKGYAIARMTASGLSDYFLRDQPDQADAELRLVYGQPVTGRQLIQLRLERNQALGATNWILPNVEVSRAKSVRGHLAVSADPGFRLTPERTQGLTEIATAFFPRKLAGIQTAFRMAEPAWQATLRVERLPQTVGADSLHLFSIGEGVAYGSSVMNYVVSGAPVSAFQIELSGEYFNVEFTGKDIRNWQKTTNGYLVQLHSPVSGAYTLLATYERPFRAQGETLTFTGARPLDAQSEQGHTLVISAYQIQVQPVEVSTGLVPLETGEVPAEYRLLFDAPILAAYRYASRPFNLRLALSPLAQGESLSLVVDRASLVSRISKAGQVLTDARYFVKNRGHPHFRVRLPAGTELWSATVNGAAVVPVADTNQNLIPLPQRADPNAVLTIDLKLAARAIRPEQVSIAGPMVFAPVMLAEWRLEPDTGQRLVYQSGSLTPVGGRSDRSGFAGLTRALAGENAARAWTLLSSGLLLAALAVLVWRWTAREGVYRFSARFWLSLLLGVSACGLAAMTFTQLGFLLQRQDVPLSRNVTFIAPVQQPESALTAEVRNMDERPWFSDFFESAWPGALAFLIWIYAATRGFGPLAWLAGWMLLAWATLRSPNGAPFFLVVLCLFFFIHVVWPAMRRLARLPRKVMADLPPSSSSGPATAIATLLLIAWSSLSISSFNSVLGAEAEPASKNDASLAEPAAVAEPANSAMAKAPPLAESVTHQLRVEGNYVQDSAHLRWRAVKGQILSFLSEPAVLTQLSFPTNALKLLQSRAGAKRVQQWVALESGIIDADVRYEVPVTKTDKESGFTLPMPFGLINTADLTVVNLDVDVRSEQSVSIQTSNAGSNTVSHLVLSPVPDVWISWKPRSRDARKEKSVYYAEIFQLYVPSAGVIEGAHYAAIRPAQGELTELTFDVPNGATITDVIDPARGPTQDPAAAKLNQAGPLVSLWRFDPDTHKLRVSLAPAQSRPFALLLRSQIATGPLPFDQTLGLISLEGAAGQIGLLGLATGNEVQLDTARADAFSPINLEDFPGGVLQSLQSQFPGLTLRRAYRYAETKAQASLRASAVEPDVRVEMQSTLSLGEDRTVLAGNAAVSISRAGIFRLSFALPTSFDVESVSGDTLSHWTESRTGQARLITLHLRGKTEGQQQFSISLAGPGIKPARAWSVPQLIIREASKQQGTVVIVPEQGMRLQAAARTGVTQLDPQKAGIRQKGVLAFRVLPTAWNLALDIEQVDPWIQVTSLQHAAVSEALVKVMANLQYQIENTGLKSFRILLSTNAESVRFQGEQIADYRPVGAPSTNGLQQWEIKLHRRMIGAYLLQASYQTLVPEQATETAVQGVQALDANLQRGFVTVQPGGRLQLRLDRLPPALQATEWQGIPRNLQQDMPTAGANFSYRLVEPAFVLPLQIDRHQAAKLLAGQINKLTLTSAISDDGVMLTQVRLEMIVGDKRMLYLTLPKDARFWFAFVNQNGVWPWREQDRILIPLDPPSRGDRTVPVEFFYSSQIGANRAQALNLELLAPKFDLPLENITWQVYLNEKWQLQDWSGSLQLEEQRIASGAVSIDLQSYLQNEAVVQREKTKEAEQMLVFGNSALEKGDPQQARRAFRAAFGLSQGDDAFNEDARVQLNNLKLQQALVGLNVRQAANGPADAVAAKVRELRNRKDANYTQQDAKAIIDRNTTEENAAFVRLAQRLIQQQDAAVSSPAAIRASIPEQGRLLTFRRAVVVDTWAELGVHLAANATQTASPRTRSVILGSVLLVLALFLWSARRFRKMA